MNANELRQRIIETVAANGGHLASSLGAVEIAMALREVFDPVHDRIVWDVGHQAYAWKLLTDRADRFGTLRRHGGLSGFPNPAESPADAAVAGHAGVAISVALGLAAARDRRQGDEHVVAVVGDAALANGTSFEALNACSGATRKLIVVLNDNEMAISRPTGSVARFLGRLIAGEGYNRVKSAAKRAGHALGLSFLHGAAHAFKRRVKAFFLGNDFFEQFGLRYVGPVDGHDVAALRSAFAVARDNNGPVIVHVVTQKGRGFAPAERNPTLWHGVGPFDRDAAERSGRPPVPAARDWSAAFGAALFDAAADDARIVALTAAMKDGTGLVDFAARFPDRFVDVGIAEGHMLAFAAGLAAGGMRPVAAVYSTFLQRATDQLMHDVCLPNLPVVICVDRAGVVGADGATHQGVFDLAMLRCLPNLTICQPADEPELRTMLAEALKRNGPTVIRYPRGRVPSAAVVPAASERRAVVLRNPEARVQIWALGDQVPKALSVADRIGCGVVYARSVKPFDAELLAHQRAAGRQIVSLENGCVNGGFGEAIGADLKLGWPDAFIPHGSLSELERTYGLDEAAVCRRITDGVAKETKGD